MYVCVCIERGPILQILLHKWMFESVRSRYALARIDGQQFRHQVVRTGRINVTGKVHIQIRMLAQALERFLLAIVADLKQMFLIVGRCGRCRRSTVAGPVSQANAQFTQVQRLLFAADAHVTGQRQGRFLDYFVAENGGYFSESSVIIRRLEERITGREY